MKVKNTTRAYYYYNFSLILLEQWCSLYKLHSAQFNKFTINTPGCQPSRSPVTADDPATPSYSWYRSQPGRLTENQHSKVVTLNADARATKTSVNVTWRRRKEKEIWLI